jgi:hypothetical protein
LLCDCIWSFGTLGILASDFSSSEVDLIFTEISRSLDSFNDVQIIQLITGLAKMGISWEHLFDKIQRIIIELLAVQDEHTVSGRKFASIEVAQEIRTDR